MPLRAVPSCAGCEPVRLHTPKLSFAAHSACARPPCARTFGVEPEARRVPANTLRACLLQLGVAMSLLTPSIRKSVSRLSRWLTAPASPGKERRFRPCLESLENRDVPSASVSEFSIPTSSSGAVDIAIGSDGNAWFAEHNGHKISRITPSGTITEYAITGDVVDLWTGQGDDLWFTEMSANLVGKINTSTGQVTEYSAPTNNAGPNGITLGADGNMWFAEYTAGKIGVIASAGTITEYTVGGNPTDLALGSDGNVWFTSYNTNQVGKITTSGTATWYSAPSGSGPAGIAAGADGNLWVTEHNTGKIAKVTTAGSFTEYAIPTSGSAPWAINAGPNGTLWFAESGTNKIGVITTAGLFREYTIPTANSDPRGVVADTNGRVWWTEYDANQIGTMQAVLTPSLTLSVTYGAGRMVTLSGQVSDGIPGSLTVSFAGKAVGSVVTNNDGTFSGTFEASALGLISATVTNGLGFVSSAATVTLASNAPVISEFAAALQGGTTWIFSGRVTDENHTGLVVRFDGLASLEGKTATVQANGTFSLNVQLEPGEAGMALAEATDWWGLDSNEASWAIVI